jgi:hypothetical protein
MRRRRRHARYLLSKSEGTLTVLRDIVVHRIEAGDFIAIDAEARRHGEVLTLEMVVNGTMTAIPVRVVGSVPILQAGNVMHKLALRPFEESE